MCEAELAEVVRKFGDLPSGEAAQVAARIGQSRPKTTFELRDCVVGCFQQEKTRKVAQVFQALRICVNSELLHLRTLCESLHKCLNRQGLALLITFHSLERDVIHGFLKAQPGFTKASTSKPGKEELGENSRSLSARMISFRRE